MVLNEPFTNVPPKNSMTVSRGQHAFLTLQVVRGTTPVTPDADMFDAADVVKIEERSNGVVVADVTADFATITLDDDPLPSGLPDTYDDNHAEYVSTVTSPVGLFQSSTTPSLVALKIVPPLTATITDGDTLLDYKVTWLIKKDGATATTSEIFNVREVVSGSFSPGTVTYTDVKDRIVTQLVESDITPLIEDATEWVDGFLQDNCGIYLSSYETLPPTIRQAILGISIIYVEDNDRSAYRKVSQLKEGSVAMGFAGQGRLDRAQKMDEIMAALERFCSRRSSRVPKMKRVRSSTTRS